MIRVAKSRALSALMVLLRWAALAEARPADAPLPKALVTHSEETEAIPRRELRPVLRAEIFQAIQSDLAQRGISDRESLKPYDLKIQSSVPLVKVDMGLQVKTIRYCPIRRETVFELWASHVPQYLPFTVTTRRDLKIWEQTSRLARNPGGSGGLIWTESPTTGQGVSQTRFRAPVLAKPGKPATLVMLGQNVRITTTVVPLQPGTKGQRILVRDLATARVMSAEVVDENQLRTSF